MYVCAPHAFLVPTEVLEQGIEPLELMGHHVCAGNQLWVCCQNKSSLPLSHPSSLPVRFLCVMGSASGWFNTADLKALKTNLNPNWILSLRPISSLWEEAWLKSNHIVFKHQIRPGWLSAPTSLCQWLSLFGPFSVLRMEFISRRAPVDPHLPNPTTVLPLLPWYLNQVWGGMVAKSTFSVYHIEEELAGEVMIKGMAFLFL